MLLEDTHLTLIGLLMIIIGICILLIPRIVMKRPREYRTSISAVFEVEDYIARKKWIVITGLIWILSGLIMQIVGYL